MATNGASRWIPAADQRPGPARWHRSLGTSVEYGRLLDLYLGLSAADVEKGLRRMIDGGDNELALKMAVAAEARYSENTEITGLKREAGDRLRSSIQFFDPFKFVVYTELIGQEQFPIPEGSVE